jgi:agmatine/peptidylarginine deiminase
MIRKVLMSVLVALAMVAVFSPVVMADPASLTAALELIENGPAPTRLAISPTTPAYLRLLEQTGRLEELGLNEEEGRVYVEALLRKMGVDPDPILPLGAKTPPTNFVRTPGEFEPVLGVVVRYPLEGGSIQITFNEMLAAIDGDPDITVYMLVDTQVQENLVKTRLGNFGVTGDNFEFHYIRTDSVWTRDYGPIFLEETVGEDSVQSMVEMIYFYPTDNQAAPKLAEAWGMEAYSWSIDFEGGNYMSDGAGTCFTSTGIQTLNPGRPLTQIQQELEDYFGCEKHVMVEPLIGEGTTHIDMGAKLLDATTMMVGEYPEGAPNHDRMDEQAAQIAGETNLDGDSFEVIRVPMPDVYTINDPYYGAMDIFRSYTNSVILNDYVLVPIYNIAMDADGLQVYEDFYADKGKQVIGVDSEAIIEWLGAVHCVTMERSIYGVDGLPTDDDDDDTTDDDDDDDDTAGDDDDDDDTSGDDDAADDDDDDDDDNTPAGDDDDDDDDDDGGCGC